LDAGQVSLRRLLVAGVQKPSQRWTAGLLVTAGEPNGATASLRVIAAHLLSIDNGQ
jgi:hypothetical protein